jgi:hypothetical protein
VPSNLSLLDAALSEAATVAAEKARTASASTPPSARLLLELSLSACPGPNFLCWDKHRRSSLQPAGSCACVQEGSRAICNSDMEAPAYKANPVLALTNFCRRRCLRCQRTDGKGRNS